MFYVIQMADFHFGGSRPGGESEKDILNKMARRIKDTIPEGSTVVFCACGDYIDSKPVPCGTSTRALTEDEVEARYQEARETIRSAIIEPLEKAYCCQIGLCVGNHDATHVDAMNRFSQAMIGRDIDKTYCIHLDSENVDFIFINSCPQSDHSHGEIDYDALGDLLQTLDPDSAKYFVLHHALMSMDENDQSSVRQVPRLIELIDQYSVKAVFHGHTHGQYVLRAGVVGCPIVGVGAVYVRDYPNVNSQFNLIYCNNGLAVSGDNYQYHADLATNPRSDGFQANPIYITKEGNFFFGSRFSKIYDELVKKVRAESTLYHVHLHVKSSFDEFCADVERNYGEQVELKTLDKEYSYATLAEMWEAPQLDEEALYFNHGMYFSADPYSSGIDYIIHEIGDKRTTSRAVLVTVNTKEISKTAPDGLLPSLLSIQVGFDQDQTTLHITMTLRALEASRFLKINICEVLFIAKELHRKYPFCNIEVAISAFRVQIKEQFGCFLKAKLDTEMQRGKIMVTLSDLRYQKHLPEAAAEWEEIIHLIEDKRRRSETVIVTDGIINLLDSVATLEAVLPSDREPLRPLLAQVHGCLTELLELLNKLKQNRASSSEQTEDMSELEDKIQHQYDVLISEFKELMEK